MERNRVFAAVVVVCMGGAMMACSMEEAQPTNEDVTGAITSQVFSGRVIDTAGAPVVGARVTINGIARLTGTNGQYSVSIADSRDGYRVDIRKDGFGPLTEFRLGGAFSLVHQMQAGFFKIIDPSVSNVIVEPNSGIQITVPANSLRSNSGAPVGPVRFTIIPHSSQTMPGDFTAVRTDGREVALVSVGAVTLQAADSQNNTLALVPNASLNVTLPVPASAGGIMPSCVLSGACRTVMWRFSPATGRWIEQPKATPALSSRMTVFKVPGSTSIQEVIDAGDGLGSWNTDLEHYTPACTVIEFVNVPLSCYGAMPEPGIKVDFSQALASTGTASQSRAVHSSDPFLVLYNLRPNLDEDLSFTFPSTAPAGCAAHVMITASPGPIIPPASPLPANATRLSTGMPWGGTGYPKDPTDSMHPPIDFMDVATGNHPCHSSVQVTTSL